MANPQAGMAEHRQAVTQFLKTAEGLSSADWERPRAPGKWSPSQVVEHLALTYEISRDMLDGRYPDRAAPRLARPFLRTFFLKPTLKRGHFGKPVKTLPPFEPAEVPIEVQLHAARLRAAASAFETDLEAAALSGTSTFEHPFFGKTSLTDYLRFQVIHTNHHRQQLTTAG
jgi:uncharacterized damage-inducible protein DinB